MDEGTPSGTIAIPQPSNPAGESAKTELAKIMSDPTHPDHLGYQRNDPRVVAKIKDMYDKAVPNSAPEPTAQNAPPEPPTGDTVHAPTMTPEDRVAQAETEVMLQRALGADYHREMADMRIAVRDLCATPDVKKALTILTPFIEESGDLAQALGIRCLAEVGRSVKTRKGGTP